jgi:hypothetical protein
MSNKSNKLAEEIINEEGPPASNRERIRQAREGIHWVKNSVHGGVDAVKFISMKQTNDGSLALVYNVPEDLTHEAWVDGGGYQSDSAKNRWTLNLPYTKLLLNGELREKDWAEKEDVITRGKGERYKEAKIILAKNGFSQEELEDLFDEDWRFAT